MPAVVRSGIDRGVTAGSLATLLALSGVGLAVVGGQWIVGHYGQRVTGRTGERLLYLLRVKTFAQLQRLGLDYYEREPAGRIMTRMTTDVDALSSFLQTGLISMFVSLLTIVGVLVALVLLDGPLSLVLLGMLPVLLVATLLFRRFAVPTYSVAREAVSLGQRVACRRTSPGCGSPRSTSGRPATGNASSRRRRPTGTRGSGRSATSPSTSRSSAC